MSGRGRGRGRGYTPPSGSRLQLQKAAEDCGFDARNLRSLQSRPEVFPDIVLHSSGIPMQIVRQKQAEEGGNANAIDDKAPVEVKGVKRSAITNKLIQKGREISNRMQNSAFYVKHAKDVPDVTRYNSSNSVIKAEETSIVQKVMMNCLGGRQITKAGLFLPDELIHGGKKWRSDIGSEYDEEGKKLSLEELEAREKLRLRRLRLGLEDDDEDKEQEFVDDEIEQEQEEEFEGGYAVNHYDSDREEEEDDEAMF